jgi:nucleoid-associated protein Lsr2
VAFSRLPVCGGMVTAGVAADTRTVKEWARANGYQVRERGRIPRAVMDAFDAAN